MEEKLTRQEEDELRGEFEEILRQSNRAIGYHESLYIISAHVLHYHGQKQYETLTNYWSHDYDNVMYSSGHRGMKSVMRYFHGMNDMMREAKTAHFAAMFPDRVQDTPEFRGVGDYCIHAIFCPHIVVSEDAKTAVGMFHAPAICSEVGIDGVMEPYGEWGGYGVNFHHESDGRWRIWQINQLGDFIFPMDPYTVDNTDRPNPPYPPVAEELRRARGEGTLTPEPNFHAKDRGVMTLYRVAAVEPEMQEPYETWDESLSYMRDYKVTEYHREGSENG